MSKGAHIILKAHTEVLVGSGDTHQHDVINLSAVPCTDWSEAPTH